MGCSVDLLNTVAGILYLAQGPTVASVCGETKNEMYADAAFSLHPALPLSAETFIHIGHGLLSWSIPGLFSVLTSNLSEKCHERGSSSGQARGRFPPPQTFSWFPR